MNIFRVSTECMDLGLRAGALLVRDVQIAPASAALRAEADRESTLARGRFPTGTAVRGAPGFAPFHEILRAVGVKPRRYPSSVQKLFEFAVRHGTLPVVNNLVDAYNLASLRTLCSIGAHDLDRLRLPVELRLFTGSESFRPLGSEQPRSVNQGEFGYVDAEDRVICRLDSLQAEFSKVTERTSNVLLIVEATAQRSLDELRHSFEEIARFVCQHSGGTVDQVIWPFTE